MYLWYNSSNYQIVIDHVVSVHGRHAIRTELSNNKKKQELQKPQFVSNVDSSVS